MLSLIRADMFKVLRSKSYRVMGCISLVSAILMLFFSHAVAEGTISLETGISVFSFFCDAQMINLLACVVAGLVICSDFDTKVIDSSIAVGYSRGMIAGEKVILIGILVALLLVPYLLVLGAGLLSGASFSAYIQTPILTFLSLSDAGTVDALHWFGALSVIVIVYLAQSCICIPLVFLFKKPVIALAVSYAVLILLGPVSNMNEMTRDVMSYTPFGVERVQSLSLSLSWDTYFSSLGVCVVFMGTMAVVSYLIFRKAEMK